VSCDLQPEVFFAYPVPAFTESVFRWRRNHAMLRPDGKGVVMMTSSMPPPGEDVPSFVELRWRPGEHQAALT